MVSYRKSPDNRHVCVVFSRSHYIYPFIAQHLLFFLCLCILEIIFCACSHLMPFNNIIINIDTWRLYWRNIRPGCARNCKRKSTVYVTFVPAPAGWLLRDAPPLLQSAEYHVVQRGGGRRDDGPWLRRHRRRPSVRHPVADGRDGLPEGVWDGTASLRRSTRPRHRRADGVRSRVAVCRRRFNTLLPLRFLCFKISTLPFVSLLKM